MTFFCVIRSILLLVHIDFRWNCDGEKRKHPSNINVHAQQGKKHHTNEMGKHSSLLIHVTGLQMGFSNHSLGYMNLIRYRKHTNDFWCHFEIFFTISMFLCHERVLLAPSKIIFMEFSSDFEKLFHCLQCSWHRMSDFN